MMANSSAKNIGATSANSTAAEPRRLPRNRRSMARSVNLVGAGEGIKFPSSSSNHLPCSIAETDCLSVSGDPHPAARAVKDGLTANDPGHGDEGMGRGMETRTRREKLARVRRARTILAPANLPIKLAGWSYLVSLAQFVLVSSSWSVRLGARTGIAAGRAAQRTGLTHRVVEVGVAVAERHATLANRHAAVGLAVDPAIDGDEPIARTFDLDLAIDQDLAAPVERDEIGGAIALSGHDDHATGLERDVGDHGIADHDGRHLAGQPHQLGLVDIHGNGICGRLGKASSRRCQHRGRNQKTDARMTAQQLFTHTLTPGTSQTGRSNQIAAEPVPDAANLPSIRERSANSPTIV